MILSNILGGLGNQMFQYAAGRALSLYLGTSLQLDVSAFTNYKLHQGFELQRVFHCQAEIATEQDIRRFFGWQSPKIIRKILAHPQFKFMRPPSFIVEPHFSYWLGIKKIPDNSYLAGYWQSEKYFQDVADVIRSDFTFIAPLSLHNAKLTEQISQANSVSLHVRRGDYVKNPQTNATHGLCSLQYYRSAIEHITERVDQPSFFIFSDDIPWARKNLKIDFPCRYVDHNRGSESYNDMRLMSLCQHNIIANSSFSWWGAWLNANPRKIIVAPQKWFAHDINLNDLFPKDWVTL